VVPGGHDVRQGEERREECFVEAGGDGDERAGRLGDADPFALTAADVVATPESTVTARGLQAFESEVAGAVGGDERSDDGTYIDCGSAEVFRDETVAYASGPWAAGGDCRCGQAGELGPDSMSRDAINAGAVVVERRSRLTGGIRPAPATSGGR